MRSERDLYIVIEVPHQMPVRAATFEDEAEALAEFTEQAARSTGAFDTWVLDTYGDELDAWEADEATREAIIWEWAAHDLSSLHRYTLDDARKIVAWLDRTSGKDRNRYRYRPRWTAALRRFVKGE